MNLEVSDSLKYKDFKWLLQAASYLASSALFLTIFLMFMDLLRLEKIYTRSSSPTIDPALPVH